MAQLSLIGNVAKHIWRPRYGPDEMIGLRAEDGVDLVAARLAGPVDARLAVVLVHGFALSSRTPRVHAFAHDLARRVPVIVPDLRGHGDSGGLCTLGERETLDVAAAVAAVPPGLPVVTVGISLGGAAVLLHAGARHQIAAPVSASTASPLLGVVAVSAPAWWGAWDTPSTARIRRFATTRVGRKAMAGILRTRVADHCGGVPDSADLVRSISPAFTLVVHDPADHYFGSEHAQTLYRWASEPRDLWLMAGLGHGTDLLSADLANRIVDYAEGRLLP